MVKTIALFIYLGFFLLITIFGLGIWLILTLMGAKKLRRNYTRWVVEAWARHFLWLVGARVEVEGLERIPRSGRVCFIANHQSILDILCILGYSGMAPGFIAKKELIRAPIMNLWMMV
ncbi:MAG TPA: lysophospholipid acyltransferase family protein, partial [Spirochaetales bacterium]|nr:lysophospholipid acyltransferase family protein [Spirochaetales bacterium]